MEKNSVEDAADDFEDGEWKYYENHMSPLGGAIAELAYHDGRKYIYSLYTNSFPWQHFEVIYMFLHKDLRQLVGPTRMIIPVCQQNREMDWILSSQHTAFS